MIVEKLPAHVPSDFRAQAYRKPGQRRLVIERERLRRAEQQGCRVGGPRRNRRGASVARVPCDGVAKVEIGVFPDGESGAEVGCVKVADVNGIETRDFLATGEESDAGYRVQVQLGISGVEGKPGARREGGMEGIIPGARAVHGERNGVGVVILPVSGGEQQTFGIVLRTPAQGVKVAVGDGRERVVGEGELTIERDGKRLYGPQPQAGYAGVDVIVLRGGDAFERTWKLGEAQELGGADLAHRVMIAAEETDHRREAIVDVGGVGDGADSQELEDKDVLGRSSIVELVEQRLAGNARGVNRRVVRKGEVVSREDADGEVARGGRPAGITGYHGLQIHSRSVDTQRILILREGALGADVADARIGCPVFSLAVEIASPKGGGAMRWIDAIETGDANRSWEAGGRLEQVGTIFFEIVPGMQPTEAEPPQLDVVANPEFVVEPFHILEC